MQAKHSLMSDILSYEEICWVFPDLTGVSYFLFLSPLLRTSSVRKEQNCVALLLISSVSIRVGRAYPRQIDVAHESLLDKNTVSRTHLATSNVCIFFSGLSNTLVNSVMQAKTRSKKYTHPGKQTPRMTHSRLM